VSQEDPVLIVAEVRVIYDEDAFRTYQLGARAQLRARGGEVLGRGTLMFEGEPAFGQLLVQRWPSEAAFREWQSSDEYRPLLELRNRAANIRIAIVALNQPPVTGLALAQPMAGCAR
jgi:uncharacterized protein (DUF1330 family)